MTIHNDKIDAAVSCVHSHLGSPLDRAEALEAAGRQLRLAEQLDEIGRASCRERV